MRLISYFLVIVFFHSLFAYENENELKKAPKIIGLIAVRNEESIVEQCLRALSCYVDSIVILDDASTDQTLNIIQKLLDKLPIEQVICCRNSSHENRSEGYNKQKLLNEGRRLGGTHFVLIDADEMFSACCLENNYLHDLILSLKSGQAIALQMPHLWRGLQYYRDDYSRWSPSKCWCGCIFCDDQQSNYYENNKDSVSGFIHINRIPNNRVCSKPDIYIDNLNYSILHFRFVNWKNILIKRSWYMCLEWIRAHKNFSEDDLIKRAAQINFFYSSIEDFNEEGMNLKPVNPDWLNYPFFNGKGFLSDEQWRSKQILKWFREYGREFFACLDIWDIDWDRFDYEN